MQQGSLLSLPLVGLPIELLKHLLEFVPHRDLPSCCRVSKLFHSLSAPILYRRLWLRDQNRLRKVFTVLGQAPHLCELLRVVEIRVFPFGLAAEDLEALEVAIIRTFQHAFRLEELMWTRTGSLNDRVLRTIFERIPRLRLLELTGDSRSWSPSLLIDKMPAHIERFSIIMPDRAVTERLPLIAQRLGPNLESLSILSNNAGYIRDASIEAAASYLTNLTRLSLVGCKNVTGSAVLSIVKQSPNRILELSLEGLSLTPEHLLQLSLLTRQVRNLAITHPAKASTEFYDSLAQWIEGSVQLCRLTFYRMSGEVAAPDEEEANYEASDDEDGDQHLVSEDTHHQAAQPETAPTSTPTTVGSSSLQQSADHVAADTEARSEDTDAEPGEALLPFSSLQISSPHLQPFRNQRNEPQPATLHSISSSSRARGTPSDPLLSTVFLRRVVDSRGAQLRQLRIHRLAMTTEQLGLICHHCPRLEDLVVHLYEPEPELVRNHLCALPNLRSVHILASLRSGLELDEAALRDIAASASNTLRQIGFRNRVWEVVPVVDGKEGTEVSRRRRHVALRRWDASQGNWPEAFLVVRV